MSKIISNIKDQASKVRNMSADDFADIVVGNTKVETVGTGVTLAGLGIIGWGLLTDDHADVIEGAAVSAVGLSARALSFGYKIYKFLGGTPAPGDKAAQAAKAADEKPEVAAQLNVSKEQAEDQLSFVDAAKTDDAKAELLKNAAIQLGLDPNRWIQLSAKAREQKLNKPECQLYNAIVKFAELSCQPA